MSRLAIQRENRVFWVVLAVVCAVHLAAYFLVAYPAMPQTVPVHWGVEGTVDGWGDKTSSAFVAVLPAVIAVLMFFVPSFDPKGGNFVKFRGVYLGMTAIVTALTLFTAWMTPLTVFGVLAEDDPVLSILVNVCLAVLVIALGAYSARIEPNYTFGIRLPWTLASEDSWRRTHRFAGFAYVAAGVVMLVAALFTPVASGVSFWVEMAALLVATAAVGLYSYLFWCRAERG